MSLCFPGSAIPTTSSALLTFASSLQERALAQAPAPSPTFVAVQPLNARTIPSPLRPTSVIEVHEGVVPILSLRSIAVGSSLALRSSNACARLLEQPQVAEWVGGFITAGKGYAALPNTAFIADEYLRLNATPRLVTFNTTALSASECNQLCLKHKHKSWTQLDGTAALVNCTMWRYCPDVPGGCPSDNSEYALGMRACQLQSIFTGDFGQAKSPWSELGGTLGGHTASVNNSVLGAPHACIIPFCTSDAEL